MNSARCDETYAPTTLNTQTSGRTIRPMARRSTRPALLLALALMAVPCLGSNEATAADPGTDLAHAVRQMNSWLSGSDQADGWRRFLMLNVLDTQTAKGTQADLDTLGKIESRFGSDTAGLDHPMFARVHRALKKQISLLSRIESLKLEQQLADAKNQYHAITIAEMESQRDQAVDALQQLFRYYRRSVPSRDRANLYFDLEYDQLLKALRDVQFELPPEVSVGKLSSQIRQLELQRRAVVDKIDAIPTNPKPPAEGQPEGDQDKQPQEPENQETLQELTKQRDALTQQIQDLQAKRSKVSADDRPRRVRRATFGRELQRLQQTLLKVSKRRGDPYFVSALSAYERFVLTFTYGTDDNLQEKYLNRLAALDAALKNLQGPQSRAAAGNVGDHLRWLENANQAPELIALIRNRYSNPNAIVSVSGSLLNELAGQTIQQTQAIRQNVSGRLVRGTATTNADVTVELFEDPDQVHANIHLFGSIMSDTYIQQGKLKVCTQSYGAIEARQSVFANVGGILPGDPQLAANLRADFVGTSSGSNLINRIASKKFYEAQADIEAQAARQAEQQLRDEFLAQTDEVISDGKQRLAQAQQDSLNDSSKIPAIYMHSTADRIYAIAKKETIATLAALNVPASTDVAPEVSVRIHESLLSNYVNKTFAGKTFTDSELSAEISDLLGEAPAGLTGKPSETGEDPEPFSITFNLVRPIQFEIEDQGFSVAVSGRRFSQGNNAIDEPLNIILRFRIQRSGDKLKLVRNGPVDFSYPDPDKTTPKIVAFRSFLDSRLNKEVADQDTEKELPDNLLPIDEVEFLQESPAAERMRLVQFRAEKGWLYVGWNYLPESGSVDWKLDLPAIWPEQ